MAKLVDHPVLDYVRGLPAYQQLLEQLREGGFKDQERFGLGLPRASRLAVLAGLHVDLQVPVVLLTNRADRALELYDELSFWLPEGNNLYFPEPTRFSIAALVTDFEEHMCSPTGCFVPLV